MSYQSGQCEFETEPKKSSSRRKVLYTHAVESRWKQGEGICGLMHKREYEWGVWSRVRGWLEAERVAEKLERSYGHFKEFRVVVL